MHSPASCLPLLLPLWHGGRVLGRRQPRPGRPVSTGAAPTCISSGRVAAAVYRSAHCSPAFHHGRHPSSGAHGLVHAGAGPVCMMWGCFKRDVFFPMADACSFLPHQLGALAACDMWALLCLGVPCRLCPRECWAALPWHCTARPQHAGTPRRAALSLSRADQSPCCMAAASAATWQLGRVVYSTPYCLS